MSKQAIGIFDSGVGGLSVWKELVQNLPNENIIYYADSANCPYGSKSKEDIISLSKSIVDFLINKGCKIVVVACNTATAAAIDFLRNNYSIPFIGMEPAVKPASLNSKTKSVAVLATEGTFNGRLYMETSQKFASDVELHVKVGDGLVEIVEEGKVNEESTKEHLKSIISPLVDFNIDHLVLGCTHYPFLTSAIKQLLPENVKIIDPAPAVVKQTIRVLSDSGLLNQGNQSSQYSFYTTGNKEKLERFLSSITSLNCTISQL